ncbi:hypothetical protein QTO34_000749 [Cnephaeus nilssonii]|uniref:Uncharacterized protein n=1 Tax=Cnephaeus nilssonii TaxID=3371016 RepID=A0AA40LX68_CNENI|nr:hypothetical protein QTO34_000749 [Eptesicus nilssonii]
MALLEAVWEPKEVVVIHCRGDQKGKDSVSEENHHTDAVARLAAKEWAVPLRIMQVPELPEPQKYTPQEEWAQQERGTAVHRHKPGDQVWVKDWKKEPPKDNLEGTLSIVELNTWIHHYWVKAAHQLDNQHPEWEVTSDLNHPLRIIFKKMADPAAQPESPYPLLSG